MVRRRTVNMVAAFLILAIFLILAVAIRFSIALWITGAVVVLIIAAMAVTTPNLPLQYGVRHVFGDVPGEILAVEDKEDVLVTKILKQFPDIGGHDDIVFSKKHNCAFVTTMEGWIWKVDFSSNEAYRFFDNDSCAIGAKFSPVDDDLLLFCTGYLFGEVYDPKEAIGIVQLNVVTMEHRLVVGRVPNLPRDYAIPKGAPGTVYAGGEISMAISEMNEQNSHPCTFPNDLDISPDGKRFYWAESCVYPGLTLGGGVMPEIITMGRNGTVWCYDSENETISLIGRGFCFADGIMLEYSPGQDREAAVLITETSKCQITRLHLSGEKAGTAEAVWSNLPAFPDGLERDEYGNVWCSLLKARTALISTLHRIPAIKPLLLRLPPTLLNKGTCAGMIGFNHDCSKPLFYTLHDGEGINSISVCCSHDGRLYLPQFEKESRGIYSIANPLTGAVSE